MKLSVALPVIIVTLSACAGAPGREEAAAALRLANPALDTASVIVRVWSDGPPWFSCAEVIAKFRTAADHAAVRDQVGSWRTLLLSNWITLHDTADDPIVEPGWCTVKLRDEAGRMAGGWRSVTGDSLPTGDRRRGWDVTAGHRRIVVLRAPRRIGSDSARVDYLLTVAPNANGIAVGADRDSTHKSALLIREDGQWRVVKSPRPPLPRSTAASPRDTP